MKRLLTTALSLLFVVSAAFGFSACGESGGGGQTGAKTYALTLSSDNAAAGTVSGGGEFEEGASVTATAAANTGFKLDGWYTSDDTLKSALAAYTFLMPASALSLKAKFSALSDGGEEPEEPDDSGWNIKVGDGTNGVRAGLHYLEYGEYPGSFVGTALNTTLEGLYNGGSISAQLTAAGSYKTNGNSTSAANKTYTSKENYAYTYQDAKYVRVSIVPYTESTGSYTYSTNDTVGEKGTINWFKVEPLRWIILNYDKLPKNINPSGSAAATQLELLTVEEIMSNIP
ncbi:MAG: hypothetical protein LBS99_02555, partial [Clostridiales bacterium]|nr:hypothetical protein [Clostridiales bacterium]